jgi:hypothetical protein
VDKVLDKRRDERNKMEAYSETDVSPTRIPGPVRFQIESQNAYELGFSHSLFGWKDNDGSFPMLPVSTPDSTRVNRNEQKNQSSETVLVLRHRIGPMGHVPS